MLTAVCSDPGMADGLDDAFAGGTPSDCLASRILARRVPGLNTVQSLLEVIESSPRSHLAWLRLVR